jgi:hypothetical protein
MVNRMTQVGEQGLVGWANHAGRPVDIAAQMMQLALEVMRKPCSAPASRHISIRSATRCA